MEENCHSRYRDGEWKEFIKVLGASIVHRLEEIENEVDWDMILDLGDEELEREAFRLKEDLSSLKKVIKDL